MGSDPVGALTLLLLRGIAGGYAILPWRLQRLAGYCLGRLLELIQLRSKVVEQNLNLAFPGTSSGALDARARNFKAAYTHLGNLVFEVLLVLAPGRMMGWLLRRRGELRGAEHWQAAQKSGKGAIFLSSHVGNWEIMSGIGALLGGIDLMIVTKHLKPEWLHRAIEAGRKKCGVKGTYEPRTLRDVMGHLKKGGTVGFVLDQYAGPPVSVRVPMFGIPVGTSTGIATMAKRTGAVILPAVSYRRPDGRWIVEIRPALKWIEDSNPSRELAMNTAAYAAVMEKDILAHPGQWLWIHRRFKGDLTPLRPGEWEAGRARS